MSVLTNWILSALTIFLVANYVPGFDVDTFTTALIVALVLGIINAFIKPIITILTLPITILTLGLFSFVINAVLLLTVAKFVQGFDIEGFAPALIAAIVLWLINIIINFVAFPVKQLAK